MISYDDYKNRIEKVAKFKKFVFKFKFLFIGIFALIIAAITGLLVAKGSISGATVLSATEIYYGEDYDVTPANAFMSKTSVEYALQGGSEWSAEKPVKAGKYLARTVSKKAAGKGHGAQVEFEIKPVDAQFVITANSVVYGDAPDGCAVQGLKLGDSLDRSSLKFIYDDYTAAETNITVDKGALKIVSREGDDRSGCYILSAQPKAMSIRERAVTLSPETQNAVYSGKAVSLSQSVQTGATALADGDRVEFTTTVKSGAGEVLSSAVDAGNYTLELSAVRVFKGETDVTARYALTLHTALLQIAQKQLKITTESATKTFDGTALIQPRFESEGLNEGHVISADNFASVTNATHAPIANTADFTVRDSASADVTRNYSITPVYGSLTVERYGVSVTTQDASKTYDGEKLSQSEYTLTSTMLGGYSLSVLFAPEIVDAGEAENRLVLGVTEAGGSDASENFAISYTYGTLNIARRPVMVSVAGGEKVYDGTPLSVFDCTATGELSLVGGHSFVMETPFSIVNAGEAENAVGVLVYGGGSDRSANYALSYVRAKLKITPRPITVTTATSTHTYDAIAYSDSTYTTAYGTEAGLLNGDKLTLVSDTKRTDAGTSENVCVYRVQSGNYAIADTLYGKIIVLPRPITVTTATSTHIYDATAYSDSTYTTAYGTESGLLNGDELILVGDTKRTDAGTSENVCVYRVQSDNYTISQTLYGYITVSPRPITVVTPDGEKIYDGTPLSTQAEDYDTYYYGEKLSAGLLNEDRLTRTYTAQLTDATSTANACRYNVPNGNYEIRQYDEGTLTVTPRPICVTTFDGEQIYNADPLSRTDYKAEYYDAENKTVVESKEGLIGDDVLEVTKPVYITDVGSVQNACEYRASSNYRIERSFYGTLTVTPRPITVVTPDDEKIYDATPLYNFAGYTTHYYQDPATAGLLNGDALTLLTREAITNFGTKENVCTYSVPKGEYGNDNYEIKNYENGELKILARPLTVITADDTKYYDSTPLTNENYTTKYVDEQGEEHAGLLGEDALTLLDAAQITDAGMLSNTSTFAVPNENYEIAGYEHGMLTVMARRIRVTTQGLEEIYDGEEHATQEYTTEFYDPSDHTEYHRDGSDAGLLGKDELTGIVSALIRDAGEIDNSFSYFALPVGIYGESNYVVMNWTYGKLKITPRPLFVETNDDSKVYDGEPLYNEGYTATYYGDVSKQGLLNGDTLTCTDCANITDKSVAENICTYSAPIGVYGNANYEIKDYGYGTLEVTARPISVAPLDQVVLYGETVYPEAYGNFEDAASCNLAAGERLMIAVKFYQTDPDRDVIAKNKGGYVVRIDKANCVVERNGAVKANGIDNYEITDSTASLIINPKPITVKANSYRYFYGDDELEKYRYPSGAGNFENAASCGLAYGETLELFVTAEATEGRRFRDVGTYAITPLPAETLINGAHGGVENYEIAYENGGIEVNRRPIYIAVADVLEVYGNPIAYPTGSFNFKIKTLVTYETGYALATGDTIEIFVLNSWGERPEIGEYDLAVDGEKIKVNGINDFVESLNSDRIYTTNYDISVERGTLTVTERLVTIELSDVADIIYGEEFVYPRNGEIGNFKNADEIDAAYGEQFALVVTFARTDRVDAIKGVEYVTQVELHLYDAAGNAVDERLKNYEVDGEDRLVYQGRLETVLTVPDNGCVYGEAESLPEEYTVTTGMGDEITFTVKYLQYGTEVTPKYAGEYVMTVDEVIAPADYNDRYVFTPISGTLTIEKRDLTVVFYDVTVKYGDTDFYPLSPNNFKNADTCGLQYGETLQLRIDAYRDEHGNFGTPKNVGSYTPAALDWKYCDAAGNDFEQTHGNLFLYNNYNVTMEGGTLTIEPKAITVQANDSETDYGEAFEFNGVTVSETAYGEAFGVSLQWQRSGEEVTPRNAGYYEIVPLSATATVDGNAERLNNYDVTYLNGTLTIQPRRMGVSALSIPLIYGEEFHYPTGTWNFEIVSLTGPRIYDTAGYDDELEVTVSVYQQEDNGVTYYDSSKLSVGVYYLAVNTGSVGHSEVIVNGEKDVNNNYSFTNAGNGKLTVSPRPIEIELADVENDGCIYGEVFSYPQGMDNYRNYETVDAAYSERFEVSVVYRFDASNEEVAPKNAGAYTVLFGTAAGEISRFYGSLTVYDELGNVIENGADNYTVTNLSRVSAEILKKHVLVTVGETQALYGDIPLSGGFAVNCEMTELAYGESLHGNLGCMKDGAEAFPHTVGVYDLYFREESLWISEKDEEGNDVQIENGLDNYDIEIDTENGKITVLQRPITIVTESADKVYDGTPLSFVGYRLYTKRTDETGEEYEDVGLVYGDELKVDISSWKSVTDAGDLLNSFVYELPNDNYVLDEELFGTLTVKIRSLVLYTYDADKIYDGEALSETGYRTVYVNGDGEEEEGLLNGDVLTVDFLREITEAGSHDNDCAYTLPSGNYEIVERHFGTLRVDRRTVYLSSENEEEEYDGTAHTASGVYTAYHIDKKGNKVDALVLNHDFRTLKCPSITDVGSVDTFTVAGIYDPDAPETDVEKNYDIVLDSVGKLTVTPRPLFVETNDDSKVYDGTPIYNEGYTATYYGDASKQGLLNGDTLTCTKRTEITNKSVEENECLYSAPIGVYGKANYEIKDYGYGTLEVTARDLAVELFPKSVVYGDANYPAEKDNFVNFETCNLANGEKLQVVLKYFYEDGTDATARNVGHYIAAIDLKKCTVYDKNGVLIKGGIGNYEVSCGNTTLDISPRELTVSPNSYTEEVYGNGFVYPDGDNNFVRASKSGLQYDEVLKIFVSIVGKADEESGETPVYPNAGEYVLVIDPEKTLLDGGREGLSNYTVIYGEGTLRIKPREITVVTATDSRPYNGLPFSNTSYTTHLYGDSYSFGLLDGDELVCVYTFEAVNADTYNNICEFEANSNYRIRNYSYGKLTITPYAITVVLNEISGTVYGETLNYPEGADNYENFATGALVNGEKLQVAVEYYLNGEAVEPKDAGDYAVKLNLKNCVVYDADGNAIEKGIENYSVGCEDRTATIRRREIGIALSDLPNTVYDGDAHAYPVNGYSFVSGALAYGESLSVAVCYYTDEGRTQECGTPTNAGKYYIAFDEEKSLVGGRSVSLNYEVSCDTFPTYEIERKAVKLTMQDITRVYNGAEFGISQASSNSEFIVSGLCKNDTLARTVEFSAQPLNAGEYTVTYQKDAFSLLVGLVSNYYLDEENGKFDCLLTIQKREITVTVNDRTIERTGNPADPADETFRSVYGTLDGFVAGDGEKVTASYTYDGEVNPPSEIGSYEVAVSFAEDEVTKNYVIAYESGTLTITGRIVVVKAVYTGTENVVYNGEAVDLSLFTFEHYHDGDALPEDDRFGFAESDLDGVTAVYTFNGGNLGEYTDGNTPVHAGTYTLTVELFGYDNVNYAVRYEEVVFTVQPRAVFVSVGDMTVTYTNTKPEEKPEFFAEGFLEQDEDAYTFYPEYYTAGGTLVERYNVGKYTIYAWVSGGRYNDYFVSHTAYGTLTVEPMKIYVRPQARSVPYTGQDIELGGGDYEIFEGALGAGDVLTVTAYSNGILKADKNIKSAKAGVRAVKITGADGNTVDGNGFEIAENYLIYTEANMDPDADYRSSEYRAKIEFVKRTLYYYLYVPEGQNTFVYTGEDHVLVYASIDDLFADATDYEGGDGLLKGHTLVAGAVRVSKSVGDKTNWLSLSVLDENGNEVTKCYDLVLANPEEATITVKRISITIEIDAAVTDESVADGSVLQTAFDGKKILNPAYYSLTGSLLDDTAMDIVVLGEGSDASFAIIVYRPTLDSDGDLTARKGDRSNFYDIETVLPDGLHVSVFVTAAANLDY